MFTMSCILVAATMAAGCGTTNLRPWHEVSLDSEFSASMEGGEVRDFKDYFALEERLFAELRDELVLGVEVGQVINRYSSGSLSDPTGRVPNWNRTQELAVENPRGGVLMLHGLTDSPYTMRSLAKQLADEGFHVIALRLPAHGTAPSALSSFDWQDVSAAVRIALRHLGSVVGDRPLHVVGYSFGGPLVVNVALEAYADESLKVPTSLVLISPAIGVSGAAAFAGTVNSLSSIPGLRAKRWSRIVPEFDPYKYNSFTYNAGSEIFKLSRHVASRIEKRSARVGDGEAVLPPVLVFQSTLDTTISMQAIIDRLLVQLRSNQHELVLFDMNRSAAISGMLVDDPGPFTERTMARDDLPFTLSLITNRDDSTSEIEIRRKAPESADFVVRPLGLA